MSKKRSRSQSLRRHSDLWIDCCTQHLFLGDLNPVVTSSCSSFHGTLHTCPGAVVLLMENRG